MISHGKVRVGPWVIFDSAAQPHFEAPSSHIDHRGRRAGITASGLQSIYI